jgi:adenosine 3'-phospho 5'-phosphosulfate transporter B2
MHAAHPSLDRHAMHHHHNAGLFSHLYGAIMAHEQLFTYTVSFGGFYLFVALSMYVVKSPEFRRERGWLSRVMAACVSDETASYTKPEAAGAESSSEDGANETFSAAALRLGICTVGIQVSYLLWGLMQERIMTKPYDTGELFASSKFLVFANRFLAFFAAWIGMRMTGESLWSSGRGAPLYKFSFSSVSNIMSSVCQYEALKFVSFPTQVLAKSCKMVPVMLMGYVVNGKKYSLKEYLIACAVTAGAAMFKLAETNDAPVKDTEFLGIVLIVGYMGADSFTSNWQSAVFKQYKVSSMAMMFYANVFSSSFTALGLLVTMEITGVLAYLGTNPSCLVHICIMAVCSAVGQLFIFYTIKRYGPLVFATIQTVRQFLSVVLSIVFFSHPLNGTMAAGIAVVFLALGAQIADKWRSRPKRPNPPTPPNEAEQMREMASHSDVDLPEAAHTNAPLLRPSAGSRNAC